MKKSEQDPLNHMKQEADEVMFENLHFNSKMRAKVLQDISSSQANGNSFKRWVSAKRNQWMLSSAAVAVATVMMLVIVLDPLGNTQDITQPDVLTDPSQIEMTNPPTEVDILIAPEDPGLTVQQPDRWTLSSLEEAEALWEAPLSNAITEGTEYTLISIEAEGITDKEMTWLFFDYSYGDQGFQLEMNKQPLFLASQMEKVDMNGIEGYFEASTKLDDHSQALLTWSIEGVQYTLKGSFSKEETIQIASSFIKN